jgi:putative membrane protein
MSNQQLIKSAHVWAVVVLLFGVIVFATKAGSNRTDFAQQNTNSNTNTNQNQNTNQNANANTSNRNATNSNVSGEQPGTGALSSRDQKFITNAVGAGLVEVQLGRWAAQNGTSPEVKQFGKQMIEHHSKANTELMQLASSKGLTLPTELDEKQLREVTKVSRLTGADFDKAFSKKMLKDHEGAVSDFEKQSTNGDDADVKAFAAKALPTLQEHLQMARALPANAASGNSNANSNTNSNSNSNSNRNNNGNSNSP